MLIICSHEKSKSLISVSVQTLCTLNCTRIHPDGRKNLKKKPSVAGIEIYQEKWANSMVADAQAPHIASSSVAIVAK